MAVVLWGAADGALVAAGRCPGRRYAWCVGRRLGVGDVPVRVVVGRHLCLRIWPPRAARPPELERLRPWCGGRVCRYRAVRHSVTAALRPPTTGPSSSLGALAPCPPLLPSSGGSADDRRPASLDDVIGATAVGNRRRSPVSGRPPGGVRRRPSLPLATRTSRRCPWPAVWVRRRRDDSVRATGVVHVVPGRVYEATAKMLELTVYAYAKDPRSSIFYTKLSRDYPATSGLMKIKTAAEEFVRVY